LFLEAPYLEMKPPGEGVDPATAAVRFTQAQVDIWRRAGAGDAGQLQRVLCGQIHLQKRL